MFSSDAFVTTNRNKVFFIYYLHLYYMYLRIPCELGLSWQTHWLSGEPIFGPFLLNGFWTNWPLRVHNCLVVNLSTYLLQIILIVVKTIEKEKQWLNTLFSWKVCTGTKPKPNLKTLYNGTSPVHLCLTFTWTCVFCFSLSLKYFGFLYDVFIVHFFAHFFLSSQPWVFVSRVWQLM